MSRYAQWVTLPAERFRPPSAQWSVLLVVLLALDGCRAGPPVAPAATLHGKYQVTPTGQKDDFDEPFDHSAASAAVLARGSHAGDTFAGTDRGDAKTSIATGDLEAFSTITALRASLPPDEHMIGLGISKAPDSNRTPDEQRNVTVGAVIYAISKESDNDFHLITGDPDCPDGSCLMNVEVSGLPKSDTGDSATLKATRTKFLSFFDGTDPGTSGGYDKFDPPIRVTLTGSLFFDVDHKAGVVGPAGRKPDSAWEIHPLTDIAFEP